MVTTAIPDEDDINNDKTAKIKVRIIRNMEGDIPSIKLLE